MCIAILNKNGTLKDEYLKNSWENNNQGAGLLYVHNDKLNVFKTYDYAEFVGEYKKLRKNKKINNIILHFRIATSGFEKYTNLHPFLLNENMGFVHNGIISGLGNKQYSDTYEFNEMLKKLPNNFLNNSTIVELLSGYLDSSKLIFLDYKDNYSIINEQLGIWDNDNWYSNDSYLSNTYKYYYYGNKKINRNDIDNFDYFFDHNENINGFEFYSNVTEENLSQLEDIFNINKNSNNFITELEDWAYYYQNYDLNNIIKNLKKDYEIV